MRALLRRLAVVAIVLVTAAGAMALLPLALSAQGTVSEPKPLAVRETVLAVLDAAADRDSVAFDRGTARRAAWITGRKGSWRLVIDGVQGPEFTEVSSPDFSPDGSQVAYRGKRGKKWFVVLDGKEYGGYEATWDAVFSAGNGRVGWAAKVSPGQVVHVIDGVQHGPYDLDFQLLRVIPPVFSDDGRHVAFRAAVKEGKQQVVRIVVDGVAGPPHRWTGRPAVRP